MSTRRGFRQAVVALRNRNFAIFWFGALVSNSGTWMQNVTVPYVIYASTGSAALVGAAGFFQFIPALLFGPVGGWLADRHARRSVILVAQATQAGLAVLLWAAYVTGHHAPSLLLTLVFLTGTVNGLTIPSWQAFVNELVPRKDLLNAITLNSAQFNAARAVGPAMAGIVLSRLGASWAFALNALSYAAVIGALAVIPPIAAMVRTERPALLAQFRASVRCVRASPGMLAATSLLAIGAGLGQPILQLMPVLAAEVFDVEAWRFGLMASSLGAGGVIGALLLGVFGSNRARSEIVRFALPVYAVALVGVGAAPDYWFAIVALLAAGALYLAYLAPLNTTVQIQAPDHLRGGVLSVHVMTFNLAYPVGSLSQGAAAQVIGARATVLASATAIAAAAAVAWRRGMFARLDGDAAVAVDVPQPGPAAREGTDGAGPTSS